MKSTPRGRELFNLNFQSLEVVDRGTCTQVTENLCALPNLSDYAILIHI